MAALLTYAGVPHSVHTSRVLDTGHLHDGLLLLHLVLLIILVLHHLDLVEVGHPEDDDAVGGDLELGACSQWRPLMLQRSCAGQHVVPRDY